MKKVHDFSQLKYLLATGNTPDEKMPSHKGNWSVWYNNLELEKDLKYDVCVNKVKVYSRFGNIYKDKTLFKIKPYLNKI